MAWTKMQRLAEFQRRLLLAAPAVSLEAALQLVTGVLTSVEDEYSEVPFDSNAAESLRVDGRMYPPDENFRTEVAAYPGVACYRQRGHRTLIGPNGAIRIELKQVTESGVSWKKILSKPGADGKEIE